MPLLDTGGDHHCMEEQIKYMQSEYEKAVSQGDEVKSETLSKWMKNQYADISDKRHERLIALAGKL